MRSLNRHHRKQIDTTPSSASFIVQASLRGPRDHDDTFFCRTAIAKILIALLLHCRALRVDEFFVVINVLDFYFDALGESDVASLAMVAGAGEGGSAIAQHFSRTCAIEIENFDRGFSILLFVKQIVGRICFVIARILGFFSAMISFMREAQISRNPACE